jgi:hypothetical protein
MRIISLAAIPAAFLLPSRSTHVTAGKLALISMLFATFFLFTAGYHFPGGASHYPNWADAIIHGKTLPPDFAQREVGLPLLYILAGFPFSHSFIGITLIYALIAVLIPVLVYLSIARASRTIAFFMGIVCILSLAPFTYIKFFYPDQFYMFINLLAITLLIEFFWTGHFRMLYFFTLAAVMASFTRTAGNLMYPVLMSIAYVAVRGQIRHYLGCALIFLLAAGAYQWHRYEVFDMRNQPSTPSGKGMQVLYSTYLYLGDFGYRLSPDLGPNTKRLFDRMREELQPTVRDSALIKKGLGDSPPEFMEKYFYALTPEELIEKIATEPNEEYYWNVVNAVDTNDQFFLEIAKEIARAYPWYIVRYSMRNLWHALFDPGYATTRYNTLGFIKTGGEFPPSTQGWGVRSEDPVVQYGSRAAREMEYFQLKVQPLAIQQIFSTVEILFLEHFHKYVWVTAVPLVIAWIGAFFGLLCWAFPRWRICGPLMTTGGDKLMAPVIAASALLLYEDLATSMFSQPVYRYFHMTEPWRLVIAGYGLAYVTRVLSRVWRTGLLAIGGKPGQLPLEGLLSVVQRHDLLDKYFDQRRGQWLSLLVVVNVALFAWWTSSIIAYTRGSPPIEIFSATYGQTCRGFVPTPPARNSVHEGNVTSQVQGPCIFSRCRVLVDDTLWGDPAPGCAKDFLVSYRCKRDQRPRMASIDAEAAGKTVELDCYAPAAGDSHPYTKLRRR